MWWGRCSCWCNVFVNGGTVRCIGQAHGRNGGLRLNRTLLLVHAYGERFCAWHGCLGTKSSLAERENLRLLHHEEDAQKMRTLERILRNFERSFVSFSLQNRAPGLREVGRRSKLELLEIWNNQCCFSLLNCIKGRGNWSKRCLIWKRNFL